MALTPSQQAAVSYDRNLILFAGPGSGKTSTTVDKARRILSTPGSRLGMMTFTKAAAGEMLHRLEEKFRKHGSPLPKESLLCGTFNSLSLRHYQKHSGTKKKLLAPQARSAMVNQMLFSLPMDEKGEAILALDRYHSTLNPDVIEFLPSHKKFIAEYLAKMEAANATDLATIMRDCTIQMGSGQMPLLPVTHLLGDEMQDADEVQLEFMLHHSRAGVITTLVADDDQTIYEWRNALGYAGLQRFAHEAKAKTITLGENFRSREEVVKHATQLIAYNDPDRVEKDQVSTRGTGGCLLALASSDIETECDLVASAIHEYWRPGDTVAVLARTNRSLDAMEEGLSILGVPYRRDGPSIWDTSEISTFIALLRGLLSASHTDLLPVLMLLPLDATTRRQLDRAIGAHCVEFLEGAVPPLSSATPLDMDELTKFTTDTSNWRRRLLKGEINLTLPNIKEGLLDLLRVNLNEEDGSTSSRMRRVRTLLDTALHILTKLEGSLKLRLSVVSRMQSKTSDGDAVQLMTMHSSKGLEFDTVFLINAKRPDDASTLMADQPERRLFYVAITRAKERFAATYSGAPIKYIKEAGLRTASSLSEMFTS